MRIVVAPLAAQDLQEAYDYIADDSVEGADRLLARVSQVLGMLASRLVIGRTIRLKDGGFVSTWPVPPYRLYYRLLPDQLDVLRVYHQARRPIEE